MVSERRPRSGVSRGALLVVLALGPVAGAAIAGMATPPPKVRFAAEAGIVVNTDAGAVIERAAQTQLLAALLRRPQVLVDARFRAGSATSLGDLRAGLRTQADGDAGLVRVTVHERSADAAVRLADELVAAGIGYVRPSLGPIESRKRGGDIAFAVADFESSAAERLVPSAYSRTPLAATVVRGDARFGTGSLLVRCAAVVACGPAVNVDYPFRKGRRYLATVWLRSEIGRTRATVIFGNPKAGIGSSPPRDVGSRWVTREAEWVPGRDAGAAEVSVQSTRRVATRYSVDGITVTETGNARRNTLLTPRDQERLLRTSALGTPLPARSTSVREGSTLGWAIQGALFGLVLAVAALAAATLAIRRRHRTQRTEEDPDA